MRTSIVTGGAGFIGSNLCARLALRGDHVIVIDPFRTGTFANLVEAFDRAGAGPFRGEVVPLASREVRWDASGRGGLDDLLKHHRVGAVFHLGAITDTTVANEAEMIRENVTGFEAMLRWAVHHSVPVVYASSAATYGTPAEARDRRPFPEQAGGRPNNVYGFSKWLMEQVHARVWREHSREAPVYSVEPHERLGPHVVGLRFFNVFGPGESNKGTMASMVYQLSCQMLEGRSPRLFHDGDQARDQVHVDDVVECTLKAAEPEARPGVYNTGSGRATTFNEIVDAIRGALGIEAREAIEVGNYQDDPRVTEYVDMPASVRAFYQDYTCADLTRARAGLHWSPARDPIQAVGEYARYLRDRRAGSGPR